jgi:thiol-disulfide isomerase/thioredoxin
MRFRALLLLALASAATVSGLAASKPAPKAAASVLPWIDDDYARALSEAKRTKLPIFAELWAPWCHTCRSMQAFVFTDKALSRNAGQFIWLSIDTEKEQNAPFVKKFPIRAWPSFYVIDPEHGDRVPAVGGRRDRRAAAQVLPGRLACRRRDGGHRARQGRRALFGRRLREGAARVRGGAGRALPEVPRILARRRGAPLQPPDHAQPCGVRGVCARGAAFAGAHGLRGDLRRRRSGLCDRASVHRRGPLRGDRLFRGEGPRGARRRSLKLAADDRSALYGSCSPRSTRAGTRPARRRSRTSGSRISTGRPRARRRPPSSPPWTPTG